MVIFTLTMGNTDMWSRARGEANWCRIIELSNSVDPTQRAGNRLKEVKVAEWDRNADELVWLGITQLEE